MRSRAPLVKVYCAASILAASTSLVAAQNQILSIDINSFFPTHRADDSGVLAIQAALEQAISDDFVLGADGMIASTGAASVDSAVGTQNENHTSVPMILNGAAGLLLNGITNVPECDPSPYTPDEIEQLVTLAAERHQVDISLATAIAYAESRFDRQRNSPAGARGPMQLMPDTAVRFGVADVCDAPSNIEGGVRYLSWLTEQFGNPLLVAAAYNAGERRIYEYGGVPPFHETVAYLATVLNFQMGIEIVVTGNDPSPPPDANAPDTSRSAPLSGVILQGTPGEFVAGVMQF